MAIVTLRLPAVKPSSETRPAGCRYCASPVLQRWGGVLRAVKDPQIHHALVYRYRCCQCQRTLRQAQGRLFRHYPEGITSARQSQRLIHLAALCWVLGLSLRGMSAILSVFPVALCHMSVWRDVQTRAARLKRRLPRRVRVLGVDGVYPKLHGQEQPTLVCVDLGTGQPVALGAIPEKDWRAVVTWLEPLVAELRVEGNCEAIPKALLRHARAGRRRLEGSGCCRSPAEPGPSGLSLPSAPAAVACPGEVAPAVG